MNSDELFKDSGGFSYFQYYCTGIVAYFRMLCSMFILLPVYINYEQTIICHLNNPNNSMLNFTDLRYYSADNFLNFNETLFIESERASLEINQQNCIEQEINEICNKLELVTNPFHSNIRMKYRLFCRDRYYLVASSSFFCLLGVMIGNFFVGYLVDKFGRVIMLAAFGMLGGLVTLIGCYSPSIWLHSAMRFIVGIVISGLFGATNSYILESIPSKQRLMMSFVAMTGYSFGTLFISGLSYMLKDESYIQLTIGLISLLSFLAYFALPYSFKWLISNNDLGAALNSVQFIARFNKHKFNIELTTKNIESIKATIDENQSKEEKFRFRQIFNKKGLICYTVILCILLLNVSLLYYGIHLGLSRFSKDLFVFAFIINSVTIIVRVIILVISYYLGRVPILFGMCTSTSILCIVFSYLKWINSESIISMICLCVVATILDAAYSWIFIVVGEIFPNAIRTISVSLIFVFNGLGSLIASIFMSLGILKVSIYLFITGMCMGIISLIVLMKLPETKGHPLFDEIHEAEINLKKYEKYWLFKGQEIEIFLPEDDEQTEE